MHSRTSLKLLPVLLLVATGGGCLERQGRPVSPCTYSSVGRTIQVESVDKVDMLFMVDNSNSMMEEQTSLAANFPTMVNILTTGDFNQNGTNTDPVDFMPVHDLNLAVVDCNMGTGGYTVPTCTPSNFGDDGLFRRNGSTTVGGCDPTYPSFLNYGGNLPPNSVAGEMPAAFAHRFACVATLGTGGCGFEAQLEAPLKALMPTAAQSWTAPGFQPLTFFGGAPSAAPTYGHGDIENVGFERDNAVLAIVVITDEEDGSEQNPEVYNLASPTYTGDLNLRQYVYDDSKWPVDRYVNGFLSLRRSPGLLVYSAITGIPLDLAPTDPAQAPDYTAILNDPRMTIMVDPAHPNMVVPSCNTMGRGLAYPPRRVVEVAQGLDRAGAGATVQSICQADYSNALAAIIRKIANALSQACLPRALNTNADGFVDCDVVGVMPAGSDCTALPAGCPDCSGASCGACPALDRNGDPLIENGRSVCTISQLVPTNRAMGAAPPAGTGWYYDNFTSEGMANCGTAVPDWQRIAFTSQPPAGTDVRLECLQNIIAGQGSTTIASVGSFCDPGDATNATCSTGRLPVGCNPSDPACMPLSCDPVARTCGRSCMTNADCGSQGAGLVGYVCDTRPKNVVDPVHFPNDTSTYNFCVNPTC